MSDMMYIEGESARLYQYNPDKPDLSDVSISHYNHNHDPKNGQFTTGSGGSGSGGSGKIEKKKSRHQQRVEARRKKKINKRRIENLKKARAAHAVKKQEAAVKKQQEDAANARKESIRKEVLEKGNIRLARDNQELFSTNELQSVIDRYDKNQKISELISQEDKKGKADPLATIQKIQKYTDVTSKLVSNMGSFYDTYNKIRSAEENRQKQDSENKKKEFKNKIINNRDLESAYKNKSLFSKEELSNLMETEKVDNLLKSRINERAKERAAESKREGTGGLDSITKGSQIDKYEKKNAKATTPNNYKFKNKKDYERAKNLAISDKYEKEVHKPENTKKEISFYQDIQGKLKPVYTNVPDRDKIKIQDIKVSEKEIKEMGYRMAKQEKEGKARARAAKLKSMFGLR